MSYNKLQDFDEDEEDLVYYSAGDVTERDRDLLRADDEVLQALNQKIPKSSPRLEGVKKKFLPSKKVKFDYTPVGRGPGGGRGASREGSADDSASSSKGPRLQRMRFGDEEDESDDSSDIEIDLETQPNRQRAQNRAFRRKMHLLLGIVSVLAFFLFFSNWLGPNDAQRSSERTKNGRKQLLSNGTHDYYPTTVVLSLDGFHPHYINPSLTPNLHKLYTQHSSMPYMKPSFPSTTFANHWTLITGLYPENHGIVSNRFYDPSIQKQFISTDPDKSLDPVWWGGEPIWQTAAKQEVTTAVHMWVGSEVKWDEYAPIEVDAFNATETLKSKSDRVLGWLDRDISSRPELILTYAPTVDTVGHEIGIAGKELREAIASVDKLVGEIAQGLQSRGLDKIANFIVVSDHGMAPTSNDRLIYLDELIDMDKISTQDGWPLAGLRPKNPQDVKPLYETLKDHRHANDSWNVYLREDLPKEWHYGTTHAKYGDRIAPLWVVPDVGWSVTTHKAMEDMDGKYTPLGVHGYNNSEPLMRALFVGMGPYFENNLKFAPVQNIDVYNILCDTLYVTPAKNDGESIYRSLKVLPANWKDPMAYPGVTFDTEVLAINSTYDVLYRGGAGQQVSAGDHDESWGEWIGDIADDAKHWITDHIPGI